MPTFIKKFSVVSAVLVFALLVIFSSPIFAQAQTAAPSGNYGLDETRKQGNLKTALIDNSPQQVTGTIIGTVLSLLGVVFFLLIIYGGIRWMMAQGNETEVEAAKQILIAAVSGLIIVLSAYAITVFIGNQLTGSHPAPEGITS